MATHDYIISNASGAAVRADLNNALAAIATNNSSATEPTTTYAYQWWADTGSSPTVMKLRNAANSGWITLFQLDGEWTVVPFENGTAAAPSIYFKDSGTDTGLFSPGTDQVGISAGGTSRFEVSTSATTSTLPVVHPLGAVGTPSITFTGDLNTGIWSPAADTVAASTGGSERLRIDSSGRVGIGTTSPATKCVVSNNGAEGIEFEPATLSGVNQVQSYNRSGASYNGLIFNAADLRFAISGTSNEKARIDSSGRLLVGTSSARNNLFGDSNIYSGFQLEGAGIVPANRFLSIVNNYDASVDGDPMLVLGRTRGSAVGGGTIVQSGDQLGAVSFQGSQGSSVFREAARIQAYVDGTPGANDMPGRLLFFTTADGASSPTARLIIKEGGDVVIPATSATKGLWIGTGDSTGSGANSIYRIGQNSTGGGSGTLYIGNAAIQVSSDARLKENIQDTILSAVEELQKVRVVDFTWNDPSDTSYNNRNARGTWTGVIAQELINVFPFAVNAPRKEDDLSIDHDSDSTWIVEQQQLVPVLIKAIQEQQAVITNLQDRLSALEAK